MRFGERIRQLRTQRRLGQRALADAVGVNFTYISKIENGKLDFGDYPSEELILRLADALEVDAEELLLLAEKIPARIRRRVLERPDAFGRLAELGDEELDLVLHRLDRASAAQGRTARPAS
jgi:transcriptional regulator with XRE-family HTH domain